VLGDTIDLLSCPHCGADLTLDRGVVRCASGHRFDVARQGYVSLLASGARIDTADTAAMVQARQTFLVEGHYAPMVEAVADACQSVVDAGGDGCIADLGAGTGYHLAGVLARLPERRGLALDNSKHALRRAARAHPRIGAVACDVWGELPVRADAAIAVLSIFSPRNPSEIARVLKADGGLVVLAPTDRHLQELIPALGLLSVDDHKQERLEARLSSRFVAVEQRAVEYELALSHDAIGALVAMGPSARHISGEQLAERISALPDQVMATASVRVVIYRQRSASG